jgi:hypothetical protein
MFPQGAPLPRCSTPALSWAQRCLLADHAVGTVQGHLLLYEGGGGGEQCASTGVVLQIPML